MKLAVPFMLAYYFDRRSFPPMFHHLSIGIILLVVPTLLIMKQPDLGTSLLICASGLFILFFTGIRWRYLLSAVVVGAISVPLLWLFMHDYQKQRVLTFLNPERDPLGAGWNIIQSKISIGSGGLTGKGWMQGTQSNLEFLPEKNTDFIFSVFSEEFGFIGICLLLLTYFLVVCRGLYISARAQDTFSRLLTGGLTLTFFVYVFVNIGMVSGILPVVGLPLPLVSYGGTSIVTIMASFGILMSVQTHRKLLSS